MTKIGQLPFSKQMIYASGTLGWAIIFGVIAAMQFYFYLPPDNARMANLIPQHTLFWFFNAMFIIVLSGRFWDAITDPLIGFLSDKSKHRLGRRIPFMRFAVIPILIFGVLMFTPIHEYESMGNAYWLGAIQIGFYIFLTIYMIPYNALLPELGQTSKQKLRLATWQAAAFLLGLVIGSATPAIADFIESAFIIPKRLNAVQYAIWILTFIGVLFMAVPAYFLDEKRYCVSVPSSVPLLKAFTHTLKERNFIFFIIADSIFYMAVAIITASLLYYVTVLLNLEEAVGFRLVAVMVAVSISSYPLVNWMVGKYGKKPLVIFAFMFMGILFACIYFLGKFPISNSAEGYILVILFALPLAFLHIVPPVILAEIADVDGKKTGQRKEAMFYAVRYIFMKGGQAFGYALFALLILYGKDPGNEMGIRMTGVIGFLLSFVAGSIFFLGFNEKKLNEDTKSFHDKTEDESPV
jgi:GPH family glycoside/pentoside/hexuronide:cation symporter